MCSSECPDPLEQAKLAALAEFAAGAGHEINNPLATILGRAQQLLRDESDPARRQALAAICSQAWRIRDMIGDLMVIGQPPDPEPAHFDLAEAIEQVIAGQRETATARQIRFSVDCGNTCRVWADRSQITVALAELLRNALEASPDGGTITLSCREEKEALVCEVTDEGTGFAPEEQEHAFDPFYSARQAGRGLGFGLPKAWRIMTLAGGGIEITSASDPTTVTIRLPRDPAPSSRR